MILIAEYYLHSTINYLDDEDVGTDVHVWLVMVKVRTFMFEMLFVNFKNEDSPHSSTSLQLLFHSLLPAQNQQSSYRILLSASLTQRG
jgi:hypothetical protein